MAKKISKKSKLIIAVSLAAVLLVGAIVSIVLVLAATQQNISSNITISYNVNGVGARVSAKYGKIPEGAGATLTSMTTSDGSATELEFGAGDEETEKALTPNGDITLTAETGTSVIFEYRFENIAETPLAIGFTATETGLTKNIAESFYYSKTALPTTEYGRVSYSDYAIQTLEYEDVIYIYVKVAVANINLNASYNKAYNWELNQVATDEVTITLNNGSGTGGLTSVTAYANAAVPVLSAVPTAPSGQVFLGYYDAATDGTQYISNTGAGVKEVTGAMTLYAQYKTVATVTSGTDTTTITNTSEDEIYVPTSEGTTFNYGGSEYESNGEYLLLNPDQSVTMTNAGTASYADGTQEISLRPFDLADKKFYAAYGEYPQTYVGNTLNNTLQSATLTSTGKTYGDQVEYVYNGEKYVRMDGISVWDASYFTFSDGTEIDRWSQESEIFFFKVEPIIVKCQEINGNKATVMSMVPFAYGTEGGYLDNDSGYEYELEYLNSTFLTKSGLNDCALMHTYDVNGFIYDPEGMAYYYTDFIHTESKKIWLPSMQDVCRWTGNDWESIKSSMIELGMTGSINDGSWFGENIEMGNRNNDYAMVNNWNFGYPFIALRQNAPVGIYNKQLVGFSISSYITTCYPCFVVEV